MAKSKGTMRDAGMDMSDFYDMSVFDKKKPKPVKGGKKTTKTSFLKHTVKDNRKNV
jgi:hypothetical protein|tara:strand:- start:281 stop:448 length:168 start_codon:yes stop_codon:yes gene_type:complete